MSAGTVAVRHRVAVTSFTSSDTVFLRGVTKASQDEEILGLLREQAIPLEVDLSQRSRTGCIWAKYSTVEDAQSTIMALHQRWHRTSCLSARFELGVGPDGKVIPDLSVHNTKLRCIHRKRESEMHAPIFEGHCYTSDSLLIGGIDYPFPSGTYLSRVIFLTRNIPSSDILMQMITDPMLGNKYAKEISEAMAMADSVERAFKLVHHKSASAFPNVRVFVLGDGVRPLCAACLCLQYPASWKYYSIDPLMQYADLGSYADRVHLCACMSQDFEIPETVDEVNVVVACHSHAPLKEFVSRLTRPVIVITMPCCADYSNLDETPVLIFDDFEVYSPKRKICLYNLK